LETLYSAIKVRAYPNKHQREELQRIFDAHRTVYNYFLGLANDIREVLKDKEIADSMSKTEFRQRLIAMSEGVKDKDIRHWTEDGNVIDTVIECMFKNEDIIQKKRMSKFDNMKVLTAIKNTDYYQWLNDFNISAVRSSITALHTAFDKFFAGGGYPKFKSFRKAKKSFTTDGVGNHYIDTKNGRLIIPTWDRKPEWRDKPLNERRLKVKLDTREIIGKVKAFTITLTPSGEYYVSILTDTCETPPNVPDVIIDTAIGIDLGIKTLMTLSNGNVYQLSKGYDDITKKIKKTQKSLSRKVGSKKHETRSNNYKKLQHKLNRLYNHKTNKLKDDLHKITTKIATDTTYNTVCMETLDVGSMMVSGKGKLSKSISQQGWAKAITMLNYKCKKFGKNFLQVDQYFGSSKTCCKCGNINPKIDDLSERVFDCPDCDNIMDRDLNAAVNIRNQAVSDFLLGVSYKRPKSIQRKIQTLKRSLKANKATGSKKTKKNKKKV